MNCPFLSQDDFKPCSATEERYVPSEFQRDQYCTGRWHTLCPFYRIRQQGGWRKPETAWPISERERAVRARRLAAAPGIEQKTGSSGRRCS